MIKLKIITLIGFLGLLLSIPAGIKAQDQAIINIKTGEPEAKISPLIYGQFIEFLGNCINGGIYDAGSGLSDESGFRKDVLEKVRQLNTPLLRYPAGTYIKIFNWKDGIGPKELRPRTRNLIWGGVEDNQFGTAEFITYCRKTGAEPNLVVNMSTGTAMDAANWVEYCNGTTDSYYANLRRSHGYNEPFNVKYWALGNEEAAEPDAGRLQDPVKYAEEAWQFAKLMKLQDPSIKLVLCGENLRWNKIVLDRMHSVGNYLSVHVYVGNVSGDPYGKILGSIQRFENRIIQIDSLISTYPGKISSWNKWYRFPPRDEPVKIAVDEWGMRAPGGTGVYDHIVEYTWEHALGTGMFLNMFHNHSASIGLATWAQMVNILAPILADEKGSIKQTVFYPLQYFREYSGEWSVNSSVKSPQLENGIPSLNVSVTRSEDGKKLTVFAINLNPEIRLRTRLTIEDGKAGKVLKCIELNAPSVNSKNSLLSRDTDVVSVTYPVIKDATQLVLNPHSITIIQFELSEAAIRK